MEEQELVAAALQLLHDQPMVPLEALDSLKSAMWLREAVEGFPITMRRDDGLWNELGLRRHRLLITFEVTIPLVSGRSEAVMRVTERQLKIDLNPEMSREAGK